MFSICFACLKFSISFFLFYLGNISMRINVERYVWMTRLYNFWIPPFMSINIIVCISYQVFPTNSFCIERESYHDQDNTVDCSCLPGNNTYCTIALQDSRRTMLSRHRRLTSALLAALCCMWSLTSALLAALCCMWSLTLWLMCRLLTLPTINTISL